MLRKVEVVDLSEPARQFAKFAEARTFDGRDRLALLAREANFAPNDRTRERRRRDDQNEMLQRLRADRFLDLAPPVPPAFERDEVPPDREVLLPQLLAQVRRRRLRRPCANRIRRRGPQQGQT